MKNWYIGFFRYEDAFTWQRSSLYDNRIKLKNYLKSLDYVKPDFIIKRIKLPE